MTQYSSEGMHSMYYVTGRDFGSSPESEQEFITLHSTVYGVMRYTERITSGSCAIFLLDAGQILVPAEIASQARETQSDGIAWNFLYVTDGWIATPREKLLYARLRDILQK
ncbi:MAG: hypothetical protein WBP12_03320 [Candidatus Saccharimonas sp.]